MVFGPAIASPWVRFPCFAEQRFVSAHVG
jgi:hypothetical protein